jgi:Holliday junction resolvasome RuvABC endonuclease subunit
MNTLKLMGLDPSLRNTGMCLAEVDLATGAITPLEIAMVQTEAAAKTKLQRQNSADLADCRTTFRAVQAQIAAWKPNLVTGEVPGGGQDARAALSFGMSIMLLASVPVPIIEVTPKEVKLASVGKGTATKPEMIAWAHAKAPGLAWNTHKRGGKVNLNADNEHMADALAAIFAAVETTQFMQLMAMYQAKAA